MDDEAKAYIADAHVHLDTLRSTVHDALTSKSDLFLKVSLLQDIDAAEHSLRKAALYDPAAHCTDDPCVKRDHYELRA